VRKKHLHSITFEVPVLKLFTRKSKQPIGRLLVLDMEMTGLNPEEDSILSAGTVMIEHGRVKLATAEHHYFQATSLMAADVTESAHIHMITDEQREQQGESLSDWLSLLSTRLKADAWVFHHATIDLSFLKTYSERLGVSLPSVVVFDTMKIEKDNRPNEILESHAQLNLNVCRARYGLPTYRQHHAFSDALATAELYLAQQSNQK
jgi:DNA polymerase-3 subunit epsilon